MPLARARCLDPRGRSCRADDDVLRALSDERRVHALSPEHPVIRAPNLDACCQARETAKPYSLASPACPAIVQSAMEVRRRRHRPDGGTKSPRRPRSCCRAAWDAIR